MLLEIQDFLGALPNASPFFKLIGFSNPYVVVKYGGEQYTTKTVFKNLNPKWKEQFCL